MGSLGLPAIAMAVRSAFALLCFALLCGLAASSVVQSETETELKEGEVAGNQVLVEQALENRVARGTRPGDDKDRRGCRQLKDNKKKYRKCLKAKGNRSYKQKKGDTKPKDCRNEGKTWDNETKSCIEDCKKGKIWNKKSKRCVKKGRGRSSKKDKQCTKKGWILDKTTNK